MRIFSGFKSAWMMFVHRRKPKLVRILNATRRISSINWLFWSFSKELTGLSPDGVTSSFTARDWRNLMEQKADGINSMTRQKWGPKVNSSNNVQTLDHRFGSQAVRERSKRASRRPRSAYWECMTFTATRLQREHDDPEQLCMSSRIGWKPIFSQIKFIYVRGPQFQIGNFF